MKCRAVLPYWPGRRHLAGWCRHLGMRCAEHCSVELGNVRREVRRVLRSAALLTDVTCIRKEHVRLRRLAALARDDAEMAARDRRFGLEAAKREAIACLLERSGCAIEEPRIVLRQSGEEDRLAGAPSIVLRERALLCVLRDDNRDR